MPAFKTGKRTHQVAAGSDSEVEVAVPKKAKSGPATSATSSKAKTASVTGRPPAPADKVAGVRRSGRARRKSRKKRNADGEYSSDEPEDDERSSPEGSGGEEGSGKEGSGEEGAGDEVEEVEGGQGGSEGESAEKAIEIETSDDEGELPGSSKTTMKVDMTRDLLTIFSEIVTVKFPVEDGGKKVAEKGRWCSICKESSRVKKNKGVCAGWYRGHNSTCRSHIASAHYQVYSERCKEAGIEENHRCVPKAILRAREAARAAEEGKKGGQKTLDGVVQKVQAPTAFSRYEILKGVTELIVCGFHALALADDRHFKNCLVIMRPKTKKSELPTRSTVRARINNDFIDFMDTLKADILRAPGSISSGWDMWTAPHTSDAYFGLLCQWIAIDDNTGAWTMRDEVAACHKVLGNHSGANLGRYFILFLDRAGVTSKTHNKLGYVTNDNASNNDTAAEEVERRLEQRGVVGTWQASRQKLSCIGHVVQLGAEAFMGKVTQTALVESKQAIWDYDPQAEESIVNGGLDVIAVIRTLAVKIQASPQRKEYFFKLQREANIKTPLIIPLHTNTRWGSSWGMTRRAYELRAPIDAFIATADIKFGPITQLRKNGKLVKKIPWAAFQMSEQDWNRVKLCSDILADVHKFQQKCSTTRAPTLHQVFPLLEKITTRWETKAKDPAYVLFHDALKAGIDKLTKYYLKLDNTPAYVLSHFTQPYYKLNYIEENWGGEEEYFEALSKGDPDARNWQEYAREIVETAMKEYWPIRLGRIDANVAPDSQAISSTTASVQAASAGGNEEDEDEFDRARLRRLRNTESEDGWKLELQRYLDDPAADVTKHTDPVEWWSRHATTYPTVARIALDVLPIPAATVGVESLFSCGKEVATDRRSRLDPRVFEQIQCLHYHWRHRTGDYARDNEDIVEDVSPLEEFEYFEEEESFMGGLDIE